MSMNVTEKFQSKIQDSTDVGCVSSSVQFLKRHAVSIGICAGIIAAIAIGIIFELAAAVTFVMGGLVAWGLAMISQKEDPEVEVVVQQTNALGHQVMKKLGLIK